MNRIEYMTKLASLLQDIPEVERRDAMKYYNDYFDEAGEENEEQVIREFGAPEEVAENIKADLKGKTENTTHGQQEEYQSAGQQYQMNHQEKMLNFYKVIYSERSLNPMAAKIVAEETDKMIIATKQLFFAMEVHKLLHFTNPDMSAVSFAMTIHGLMDYELDQSNGKCSYETDKNLLDDYLKWFCEENAI